MRGRGEVSIEAGCGAVLHHASGKRRGERGALGDVAGTGWGYPGLRVREEMACACLGKTRAAWACGQCGTMAGGARGCQGKILSICRPTTPSLSWVSKVWQGEGEGCIAVLDT